MNVTAWKYPINKFIYLKINKKLCGSQDASRSFLITKNLLSAKTGKTCGCAMIGYLIKFIYMKKKKHQVKKEEREREREGSQSKEVKWC